MMTLEDVLANFLLAHEPIKALVVDRVDWDEQPPGVKPPAIIMWLISAPPRYTMEGAVSAVPYRVQIDCQGKNRDQAKVLASAVTDRLSGFRGVFEGAQISGAFKQSVRTRSDKDGAKSWYTSSSDYIIWSKPA